MMFYFYHLPVAAAFFHSTAISLPLKYKNLYQSQSTNGKWQAVAVGFEPTKAQKR
jgi:hypothetical protein